VGRLPALPTVGILYVFVVEARTCPGMGIRPCLRDDRRSRRQLDYEARRQLRPLGRLMYALTTVRIDVPLGLEKPRSHETLT
jgi:hypothetical protein